MIRFACPTCKTMLQAAEPQVGMMISCPHCKTQMKVPGVPAPSPAQAPRPSRGAAVPGPTPATAPTVSVAVQPVPRPAPRPASAPAAPMKAPALGDSVPWWKRALYEGCAVGRITWQQTARLARYGSGAWRRRALQRSADQAHLALGERLYIAGGGAPQVRQQIAGLEARIREAQAAKKSTKALTKERQTLVLKLAGPALAQPGVLSIAEAEHKKVKEVQAAIQANNQQLGETRAALLPAGRGDRIRLGVGYAAVAGVLLLAVVVLGRKSDSTAPLPGDGTSKAAVAKGPAPVLDLVPRDSMLFVHLSAADLLGSEPLKGVKPRLEKDSPELLKQFTDKSGLAIDDIESVTFFSSMIDPKSTGEPPGVAIIRTSGPYARDKVLKGLGNAEEKTLAGKAVHVSKKSKKEAIHFADERTILVSEEKWLEQYFENFDPKKTDGALGGVLKTAGQKHHLVFAVNPTMAVKDLEANLPGPDFKVLLEMRLATAIFDLSATEAKLDVKLTFPDADTAVKAARKINDLMGLARLFLGQVQPNPDDADAAKAFDQVKEVFANLEAKARDEMVQVLVTTKIDATFADTVLKALKKNKAMER